MSEPSGTEWVGLRRRVLGFCYQLLGSPFDAEEAAQDTLERVWAARDRFDPTRGSWTTWTLAVAHHVCIDRLRGARRRPLPRDLQGPGIEIGAPLVPAPDVPWLQPAPSSWWHQDEVGAAAERSAELRLAVTALLQRVPPRQRAVFVLRELLGLSAAETAAILQTSVAAVNSLLQRARSVLPVSAAESAPIDATLVERYAEALVAGDVDGLTSLVTDDVLFEMPPVPAWSVGRDPYRAFMTEFYGRRGLRWEAVLSGDEQQRVLLLYRLTENGRVPHTLQLLDGRGADVDHVLVYADPRLFALFEKEPARPR